MTAHASTADHAHHWEHSWAPAAIAAGATFLVPFTFFTYFVYELNILSVFTAGIGVVLVLAGVAKWVQEGTTQTPLLAGIAPMGITFFIISEVLIFFGLFAAYWTMRLSAGTNWPPAGTPEFNLVLPLIMTAILVTSSLTYHKAEIELEHDSKAGFQKWTAISIVLGVIFVGCTTYEYHHLIEEHFIPSTNVYSTAFFALTGFHCSHVLVGACGFIAVLLSSFSQRPVNKTFAKTIGIYWHFVDLVWFFVASQVYYW